ncbi:LOW QUALITY PROTEIN: hypothetical protein HID58_029875, partial [Brassica napus]
FINIFGSVAINFGTNLLKLRHNKDNGGGETPLMWLIKHGDLIASVDDIKMPRKNNNKDFLELFLDDLGTTCSDGMKGYLTPCLGETNPPIFRSPAKGMEDILNKKSCEIKDLDQ